MCVCFRFLLIRTCIRVCTKVFTRRKLGEGEEKTHHSIRGKKSSRFADKVKVTPGSVEVLNVYSIALKKKTPQQKTSY